MLIAPKTYISIMTQTQQMKIHPKMIIGLRGIITGGISVQDFSAVTKISDVESKILLVETIKYDFNQF